MFLEIRTDIFLNSSNISLESIFTEEQTADFLSSALI